MCFHVTLPHMAAAEKTDPSPFAVLLRQLRDSRHLAQRKLAAMAGLHVAYVGKIESGAVGTPTKDTVEALAAALGASEAELEQMLHAAGHLPPGHKLSDTKRPSFEVFVMGDPDLTKEQRQILIASYNSYVRMNRARRP